MANGWKSVGVQNGGGWPFEMQLAKLEHGYKVRILFEGHSPLEDNEHVWRTLEEAQGRGLQLADAFIEDSLR